jgi:lysophospholipase L1-like esterase
MRIKFLITAFILICTVSGTFAKSPKPVYGTLSDKHIKYFGRWNFSNDTAYTSYWGGAYIKVNFTGTTVKLKTGNTSNFYAKIDGGPWVSYLKAGGTIDLTPAPLANGKHSLVVMQGKDYNYVFIFKGLILDGGAATSKPKVASTLIEYIGDSITCGYTDPQSNVSCYARVCSEALGAEHTQIAFPGITLANGYSKTGMDTQYFKEGSTNKPTDADWDFSKYTPKIVVINLGTNDNNKKAPDSVLLVVYTNFLKKVRGKFPKAEVFVMRTFLGVKAKPALAAVDARNAIGDKKVHYIDTDGWVSKPDYTDGLHPSVDGNIKIAGLLEPILKPYIK